MEPVAPAAQEGRRELAARQVAAARGAPDRAAEPGEAGVKALALSAQALLAGPAGRSEHDRARRAVQLDLPRERAMCRGGAPAWRRTAGRRWRAEAGGAPRARRERHAERTCSWPQNARRAPRREHSCRIASSRPMPAAAQERPAPTEFASFAASCVPGSACHLENSDEVAPGSIRQPLATTGRQQCSLASVYPPRIAAGAQRQAEPAVLCSNELGRCPA